MTWQPTAALARGLLVAGPVLALALVAGRPALVVLVAPLVAWAALALRHRPTLLPAVGSSTRGAGIREGQAVRATAVLRHPEDVEHVV
ncbi:MAG: DUF58 domain-containing protein, partial [Actinomycetota bacterium]|nr:DUF58 domain-containing protein [Actinomycetota bacterium]